MTAPERPRPDWRQLLGIQRAAIKTLVDHYAAGDRRFTLFRVGPDAVFADLTDRAQGKLRPRAPERNLPCKTSSKSN